MNLATLCDASGIDAVPAEASSVEVATITADSRRVGPATLFAALPGARADGRAFIGAAVAAGARAVLAPAGTEWPAGVPPRPLLETANPRRALALAARALAETRIGPAPAQVVAVTGTNGKTSTVDFLRQIWAARGHRAASLGTLGLLGAPAELLAGPVLTTPDSVALADTLALLARSGVQHVALEASSHGLDQYRLDGVSIAAAGFSNLTRDHLDYHGSEAAYRAAKLRLFAELLPAGSVAAANAGMDPATLEALRGIAASRRLDLRLVGEAGDAIRLRSAVPYPGGQHLALDAYGRHLEIDLPLPGRFQADNALLAAALADAGGETDALTFLPHLHGVRGRMELAVTLDNGASAYVDYAHTPDALSRLLSALRPHATGRLIVVFGAGGDRDRGKRPMMGAIAAREADIAIVTDDNPRSEAPAAIRAEILAALPGGIEIGDRARAIAEGLAMLRPGDVLAVAGKGHEQGQTIAGTTLPFDDADTIRRAAGASLRVAS